MTVTVLARLCLRDFARAVLGPRRVPVDDDYLWLPLGLLVLLLFLFFRAALLCPRSYSVVNQLLFALFESARS